MTPFFPHDSILKSFCVKALKTLEDMFIYSHPLFALGSGYHHCVRNHSKNSKFQTHKPLFYFAYGFVGREFRKGLARQFLLRAFQMRARAALCKFLWTVTSKMVLWSGSWASLGTGTPICNLSSLAISW